MEEYETSADLFAFRSLIQVINRHTREAIDHTELLKRESKAGFDPSQPRVPVGNSTGGQWIGSGGGGRAAQAPLPRRKPLGGSRFDNWWDTPKKPGRPTDIPPFRDPPPGLRAVADRITDQLDPIGAARRQLREGVEDIAKVENVAVAVAAIAAPEAVLVSRMLASGVPVARLFAATTAQERRLFNAAQAVEEFLGGAPTAGDIRRNPRNDIVIMKDGRKFRMDIESPGFKNNGEPDSPHFHLEELRNGEQNILQERKPLICIFFALSANPA